MLSWNNDRQQYEYLLPNGDLITVSGDEFSEAVQQKEEGHDEAFTEMLEPTQWLGLVGDNPNVEIVGQ